MGLIREIQAINYSLDKKQQDKQHKEEQKILIENYKKEIDSSLYNIFYKTFKNNNYNDSIKYILLSKNEIIDQLTGRIERLYQTINGKRYYLYKYKFDIVQDLQDNFYKILEKVKKDFEAQHIYNNNILLEILEEELDSYFIRHNNNILVTYETLQNKICIDYIINDITKDKTEQQFLYNNYFKTLKKVKQFYNINIIKEQEEIRHKRKLQKEQQKIKRRDNLIFLYIINKILKAI